MLWREEAAVLTIAALWKLLAEVIVNHAKRLSRLVDWQKEQVGHAHRVDDEASEKCPPEKDMRPRHDRVRQVDGADADECEADSKDGSV